MSHQKLTSKFPTAEGLSYIHAGVISGNRRRNSHIFERAANDLYVEPPWCSERLFAVETFPGVIWDPCCGTGTIIRSARAAGLRGCATDISTGWNFLTARVPGCGPFSVVTNPPYGIAREIVERALELGAVKVAFLFPTARVHAAHWLEPLPVAHQYFLTPRPSVPPITAKKVGGGRVDFSWLILSPQYGGLPTFSWLHRGQRRAHEQREGQIKDALERYTDVQPIGQWLKCHPQLRRS